MTAPAAISASLLGRYSADSEQPRDASDYYCGEYESEKMDDDDGMRPRSQVRVALSMSLKFTVVCFALWGLRDIVERTVLVPRSNPDLRCWCGTSDAEAIAMGCKYDHLAVDWLPPHCIDEELTAEFDRAGPGPLGAWDYYADRNGTVRLSDTIIDQYAMAATNYYTTVEWHMAHCIYVWRKQFRTKFTGKIVEPWNDKEEHIMHCGGYFTRKSNLLSEIDTTIPGTDRHPRR